MNRRKSPKCLMGAPILTRSCFFTSWQGKGKCRKPSGRHSFGAALTRTFDSRTSEREELDEGMRRREGEHPSGRLLRIAGWCKVNQALVEHLRGFVAKVLQQHEEEIIGASSVAVASWPRVIAALDLAGFDVRPTILALKTRVLSSSDSLLGFEALRGLCTRLSRRYSRFVSGRTCRTDLDPGLATAWMRRQAGSTIWRSLSASR